MNFFPPSPQPPSRREGGVFLVFLCKGLRPLHPQAKPARRGGRGRNPAPSGGLAPALPDSPAVAVPDGGHGGFGRRIYQPYHKVLSPIPPTRARRALFPHGEGGDLGFSYARGFAPCIPEAESGRHRSRGRNPALSGGLAPALPDNPAVAVPDGGSGGLGRRLNLPHHEFLSPIPPTPFPPTPFPRGEGGDFWFISPGATAPDTPAPEPGRHRSRGRRITRRRGARAERGRFVTGWARTPDCTSNSFGKSSWGFGGFFQEAPNVSSFLRIFVSSL